MWAVAWNVECCVMWNRGRVWDVERCAMWNDVECGLWDGIWNVVRCGMTHSVGCGMESGTLCDVE